MEASCINPCLSLCSSSTRPSAWFDRCPALFRTPTVSSRFPAIRYRISRLQSTYPGALHVPRSPGVHLGSPIWAVPGACSPTALASIQAHPTRPIARVHSRSFVRLVTVEIRRSPQNPRRPEHRRRRVRFSRLQLALYKIG
jgi:hypothetical protein